MKLYTDQCGSAVFCAERNVMLAECPSPGKRVSTWYRGRRVPADANAIVEAGDHYREVAARFGWRLRNQEEIEQAVKLYV